MKSHYNMSLLGLRQNQRLARLLETWVYIASIFIDSVQNISADHIDIAPLRSYAHA